MSRTLTFRAEPGDRHRIDVALGFNGGADHRGRLVELSFQRLTARFSRGAAPLLPVGRELLLELSSVRLPGPLTIRVRVESRSDEPEFVRYGFELECSEFEHRELDRLLSALIDRRGAPRVQPPEDLPLLGRLRIEGIGEDLPIRVEELSVLGFSTIVPAELEQSCAEIGGLLAYLELPEVEEPLEIPCHLRSRRAADEGVLWGCEFDLGFGLHAGRCRAALQIFVERLRVEDLARAQV